MRQTVIFHTDFLVEIKQIKYGMSISEVSRAGRQIWLLLDTASYHLAVFMLS